MEKVSVHRIKRTSLVTNGITFPHCFGTASTSDVTSQLLSWERGGAPDMKNPDPYYLGLVISICVLHFYLLKATKYQYQHLNSVKKVFGCQVKIMIVVDEKIEHVH